LRAHTVPVVPPIGEKVINRRPSPGPGSTGSRLGPQDGGHLPARRPRDRFAARPRL